MQCYQLFRYVQIQMQMLYVHAWREGIQILCDVLWCFKVCRIVLWRGVISTLSYLLSSCPLLSQPSSLLPSPQHNLPYTHTHTHTPTRSYFQCIVEQFGEEIADLAPTMVTHLMVAFQSYANAGKPGIISKKQGFRALLPRERAIYVGVYLYLHARVLCFCHFSFLSLPLFIHCVSFSSPLSSLPSFLLLPFSLFSFSPLLLLFLLFPPDDDDEGAFSASQCLDTIGGVLDAVQERGDTMAQLEVLVMPLLQKYVHVLT